MRIDVGGADRLQSTPQGLAGASIDTLFSRLKNGRMDRRALGWTLAVLALGIGAANKVFVTQKLKAEPEVGRRWLRYALMCDVALFTGILLAISSATTLTGPE